MPVNVYECMFLIDTSKVAGEVATAAEKLHATLEKHNAEILASRPWDERRLEYPIKKQKKGLYYLTYFRTEGQNIPALQRDFDLSEFVLRNLILKVDPKLVDTMLAIARDEQASAALHSYHDEQSSEESQSSDDSEDQDSEEESGEEESSAEDEKETVGAQSSD